MAGFFGMFNFDKPGRGVDKDAPEKRGFFLFFDIFIRKFWRLCTLSLSYTVFCVPALVVYWFLSVFLQGNFSPITMPEAIPYIAIYMSLFLVCFLGAGPASAGQVYVLRNFSREDHAWVWDDFFSQTKANFKQGIALFLLDLVVLPLLISAAALYLTPNSFLPLPPMISAVFGCLAVIVLVIWFMMHFFLYPLMVTMDMRFGTLLRTAFQLTMAKLPQCLAVFVLSLVVFAVFMGFYFLNIGFMLLFAALGFSFVTFVYVFYATNVIDAVLESQR